MGPPLFKKDKYNVMIGWQHLGPMIYVCESV
jgi:hypothetical protein